jgi:hypothetical protein
MRGQRWWIREEGPTSGLLWSGAQWLGLPWVGGGAIKDGRSEEKAGLTPLVTCP